MKTTYVDDQRLPRPGEGVLVDVPSVLRPFLPARHFRVLRRSGLEVWLQSDGSAGSLPGGAPVALTVGPESRRIEGLVIGDSPATELHVALSQLAELREYRRYPVQLEIELDPLGDDETLPIRGTSVDLSEGGVLVATSRGLDPGTRTFVVIDVPGGAPIMAVGEALHAFVAPYENVYRTRVRFTSVAADAVAQLRALLARADAMVADPAEDG